MKIVFIAVILIILGFFFFHKSPSTPVSIANPSPTISVTPTLKYVFPVDNFFQRLTKKPFGIYITPQSSPVQPEKFTGYHTGANIEYSDIAGEVKIYTIADGRIIYSGWVSGYGGFIAIQHPDLISIYGHLNPTSLVKSGTKVNKGQTIGILGDAYSHQTDGERKHFHFGVIKGSKLDLRGYVQNQSELSLWQNPVDLFK